MVSACGSSDDSASTDSTSDESVSSEVSPDGSSAQGVQQNGPITVEGAPLDPFDSSLEDLAVGKTAPVISGESFDRTPVTVGGPTTSGNATLVVFLAHWCPHCNDEIPEILTLRDRGDLPDDLNIIGVSTAVYDDRDNFPPSSWVVEKNWAWPMLADTADSEAVQLYGGTGFPFTVMLNADGTVKARKSGSESADQILEWINAALFTV